MNFRATCSDPIESNFFRALRRWTFNLRAATKVTFYRSVKVVAGIWGNFLDFDKISLNLFVGRHWYYLGRLDEAKDSRVFTKGH